MKLAFPLNAIVRATAVVFAGAATSIPAQAAQWYIKDAYATPDSVQQIGSMPPPRARWVAPPPPAAVPVAAPEPAPAPYVDPGPAAAAYDDMGAGGFDGGGGGGGGCFLTTATVKAMGKADNGEELTAARFLRDNRMGDSKGRAATELYYLVGPTIIERKTDWKDFYTSTVRPLTAMVKAGHHELAIKRYSLETAKLVDQHASRYEDKELIQAVYDYAFGKGSFKNSILPYPAKYAKLKSALKAGIVFAEDKLARQEAALGLSAHGG